MHAASYAAGGTLSILPGADTSICCSRRTGGHLTPVIRRRQSPRVGEFTTAASPGHYSTVLLHWPNLPLTTSFSIQDVEKGSLPDRLPAARVVPHTASTLPLLQRMPRRNDTRTVSGLSLT